MSDLVNHPPHYQGNGMQVIDVIDTLDKIYPLEYELANAIKYVLRHRKKNGKQDVEKALWYLNHWKEKHSAMGVRMTFKEAMDFGSKVAKAFGYDVSQLEIPFLDCMCVGDIDGCIRLVNGLIKEYDEKGNQPNETLIGITMKTWEDWKKEIAEEWLKWQLNDPVSAQSFKEELGDFGKELIKKYNEKSN